MRTNRGQPGAEVDGSRAPREGGRASANSIASSVTAGCRVHVVRAPNRELLLREDRLVALRGPERAAVLR